MMHKRLVQYCVRVTTIVVLNDLALINNYRLTLRSADLEKAERSHVKSNNCPVPMTPLNISYPICKMNLKDLCLVDQGHRFMGQFKRVYRHHRGRLSFMVPNLLTDELDFLMFQTNEDTFKLISVIEPTIKARLTSPYFPHKCKTGLKLTRFVRIHSHQSHKLTNDV